MLKRLPELSIFFPFWNEEKNIETVVKNAIGVADAISDKWEIIMVDDGSVDTTFEKAGNLAKSNKNLRVISHQPNRGYGAALKEGFFNAKYKYIVFTDGDGQFDFSETEKFIESIYHADMVIGYRKKRKDHNLGKRLLFMYFLKFWDFMLFGFSFRDIDCAFKMFTKKALDSIGPLRSEGAMISTEILAKAKKKKLKVIEIGVSHYPRKYGDQSGANLPVLIRAFIESFMLWWDINNKRF